MRTKEIYLAPPIAPLNEKMAISLGAICRASRLFAFRFLRGRTDTSSDYLLIRGDLDLSTERLLKNVLEDMLAGKRPLVIDLKRVTYINGASLRMLLRSFHALSKVRSVALDPGESGPVRRLIAHFQLEYLLPLAENNVAV